MIFDFFMLLCVIGLFVLIVLVLWKIDDYEKARQNQNYMFYLYKPPQIDNSKVIRYDRYAKPVKKERHLKLVRREDDSQNR